MIPRPASARATRAVSPARPLSTPSMHSASQHCVASPLPSRADFRSPLTMTRRFSRDALVLGAGVVFLGDCKDKDLEVTNPNAGDTKRVLATPGDAENLLGTYFKRWHAGWYNGNPPTTFEGMANVMSLQNYSSLA